MISKSIICTDFISGTAHQDTMQKTPAKKEKKPSKESEARKSKPSEQEFPPTTGIHKQSKPIRKGKVTKSRKAIP